MDLPKIGFPNVKILIDILCGSHWNPIKIWISGRALEIRCIYGKCRESNGSTIEISCWADFALPLAGIKNSPKILCSHVIFIVFFKFWIEIASGDGDNQFLLKIRAFCWYIICLCSCSKQKFHHFFYWWQYIHKEAHRRSVCGYIRIWIHTDQREISNFSPSLLPTLNMKPEISSHQKL